MSEAQAGPPRAGFALLFSLSMAQFMVVLDFTIVNVALPSIQDGLHVAAFIIRERRLRPRSSTWPCSKTAASPGPTSP